MNPPSDLIQFLGRLHPLLVHLPIGFLVLLAALEVIARWPRFKNAACASLYVAALAAPASVLSAGCGWLLSYAGGYDARLLAWHQWTGLGVAGASLLVFALRALNQIKWYRWALFGTCGLLVVASHFGGSLTHGSDYLVRYAPGPLRRLLGDPPAPANAPADTTAPPVLAAVLPVFEKYCVPCHGPEKSKAELRLDTPEGIRKGGESGPAIVPGNSGASLMVKKLLLPPADDDHMPPSGKSQPSAADVALIQRWIEAGAPAH
jgi:uncharacterized membrane protein